MFTRMAMRPDANSDGGIDAFVAPFRAPGALTAALNYSARISESRRTGSEATPPVTAFELRAPSGLTFGIFQAAPYAALAPGGRSLVFEASGGSTSSRWIRTLDDNDASRASQYGIDTIRSPHVLAPNGVGFIGAQGDGTAVDSVLHVVRKWREQLERRRGAPSQR